MIRFKNILTIIVAPLMIAIYLAIASNVNSDIEKTIYIDSTDSKIQNEILSSEEENIESKVDIMEFDVEDVSNLYVSILDFKDNLDKTKAILRE